MTDDIFENSRTTPPKHGECFGLGYCTKCKDIREMLLFDAGDKPYDSFTYCAVCKQACASEMTQADSDDIPF